MLVRVRRRARLERRLDGVDAARRRPPTAPPAGAARSTPGRWSRNSGRRLERAAELDERGRDDEHRDARRRARGTSRRRSGSTGRGRSRCGPGSRRPRGSSAAPRRTARKTSSRTSRAARRQEGEEQHEPDADGQPGAARRPARSFPSASDPPRATRSRPGSVRSSARGTRRARIAGGVAARCSSVATAGRRWRVSSAERRRLHLGDPAREERPLDLVRGQLERAPVRGRGRGPARRGAAAGRRGRRGSTGTSARRSSPASASRQREARRRAVGHRDRDGAVELDDGRRSETRRGGRTARRSARQSVVAGASRRRRGAPRSPPGPGTARRGPRAARGRGAPGPRRSRRGPSGRGPGPRGARARPSGPVRASRRASWRSISASRPEAPRARRA